MHCFCGMRVNNSNSFTADLSGDENKRNEGVVLWLRLRGGGLVRVTGGLLGAWIGRAAIFLSTPGSGVWVG